MKFIDGNPLEYNWDKEEDFHILFDLLKQTNKKFDAVYLDRGVYNHLTDSMKLRLNLTPLFGNTLIVPINHADKFNNWIQIDNIELFTDIWPEHNEFAILNRKKKN